MLVDERLKDQLEAPIVNPAKVAVKTAEMLVALGLSQSRITYPKANYEKLGKSVFPNLKSGGQV